MVDITLGVIMEVASVEVMEVDSVVAMEVVSVVATGAVFDTLVAVVAIETLKTLISINQTKI